MPVIDGRVDVEKLAELLAEGGESESLDYKRTLDLDNRCAVVELAKDIAAMELLGGYLVVGADDTGNPTSDLTPRQASLLDEATVRGKLRRHLTEPLDVRTAVHDVEGKAVAIIYVGPNPSGWRVLDADGQCAEDGRTKTVFRKGDVFARHGSASEPWQQHDIERTMSRIVDARKEEWRREFAVDLANVVETGRGARLAQGPAAALTWRLDGHTFLDTVVEQLRDDDEIPLRLLLRRTVRDASTLVRQPDAEVELATLLDRLACLAALLIELERLDLYERVVDAFVGIYNLGFDSRGAVRGDLGINVQQLWLDLIARVIGLGGLLVREHKWDLVRQLVLRKGAGQEFSDPRHGYNNWLRHALTMAARSGLLPREGDVSLLSLALEIVREDECLRPDLGADDEGLLNSLCQFDFLACVVAMDDAGSNENRVFYPNFSRFYSSRAVPAAERLLIDENMRRAIFRRGDEDLALVLNHLDSSATNEGFRFAGWHGFPPSIEEWIRTHLPASP